jgi:FkbM family methyltransferase
MPIKSRVTRLAGLCVTLRLTLSGLSVDLVLNDLSELLVLEEIWRRGEYDQAASAARSAQTIVDLGANIGLASLWFRGLNPAARNVAVEPDPRTYAKLVQNVGHDTGTETVNVAITDRTCSVAFFSSAQSWGSRVATESEDSSTLVDGVTLDDLTTKLALERVDILKMDIEGMEWSVLPGADCLKRTGMVIGEMHPHESGADPEHFLDAVADEHGLTRVPACTARHFVFIGARADDF